MATPGFVYLTSPVDGCYKIGRSRSAVARIDQLGETLPVRLTALHVVRTADMVWLEKYFHTAFWHRRVRGEWFRLTPEDIRLVQSKEAIDSLADVPGGVVTLHAGNREKRKPTPPDRKQYNVRLGPVALRLADELPGVIADQIGLESVSQSDMIQMALVALARQFNHPVPDGMKIGKPGKRGGPS